MLGLGLSLGLGEAYMAILERDNRIESAAESAAYGPNGGVDNDTVRSSAGEETVENGTGNGRAVEGVPMAFAPRRFIRQGDVQTIIARRRPVDSLVRRTEQPMLIDAGPDESGFDPGARVKLLGYYNAPLRPNHHRGLVIVIHGWEGSSHSADVQYVSDAALNKGYSVFRLNMRDHGPGLHFDPYALNRGLFAGPFLNEVAEAVRQAASLARGKPVRLVGGSLGGNFALRISALQGAAAVPNLVQTVAICPAISPDRSATAIDSHPIFRRFFRRMVMRSLHSKQRLFPELYDFAPIERMQLLREITNWAVLEYGRWGDGKAYFDDYAVTAEMLATLTPRTTIIASRDDAIIPVVDIEKIEQHGNLRVNIQPTGGHMGFVDLFPYRRWLPQAIMREFNDE